MPVGQRAMMALCILLVTGAALTPMIQAGRASTPEPLPDLYITPAEVVFFVYGSPARSATGGTLVVIDVTVHNAGPGNSSSASVSLYDGGALLAVLQVNETIDGAGPYNFSQVETVWNTGGIQAGEHIIRAETGSGGGDANPADNSAAVNFTIVAPPTLTVRLNSSTGEVSDTHGPFSSIEFSGQVTVNTSGEQMVTVSLSAVMDAVWYVQCIPSSLVLGLSTQTANFTVTVTLLPETRGIPAGALRVEARATGQGYDLRANASAVVTVRPFARIETECDRPYQEIPPGGKAVFRFKIWNRGNTVGTFNLEVVNRNDLEGDGWTVTLTPPNVTVPPEEFRNATVAVRSPGGRDLWTSAPAVIELKTTSQNDSGFSQTFPTYAYVKGFDSGLLAALVFSLAVIIILVSVIAVAFWRRRRKRAREIQRRIAEEGFGRPLKEPP